MVFWIRVFLVITGIGLVLSAVKAEEATPLNCQENFTPQDELQILSEHSSNLRKLFSPMFDREREMALLFREPQFRDELAELKLSDYEAMIGVVLDPAKREEIKQQLASEYMIELGPLGRSKIFYWALLKALRESNVYSYQDFHVFRQVFFSSHFPNEKRLQFINMVFEQIDQAISHENSPEKLMDINFWKRLSQLWEIKVEEVPAIFSEWAQHTLEHKTVLKKMILTALSTLPEESFQKVIKLKDSDGLILTEKEILENLKSDAQLIASKEQAYLSVNQFDDLSESMIIALATNQTQVLSNAQMQAIKAKATRGYYILASVHNSVLWTGKTVSLLLPVAIPKIVLSKTRTKFNLNYFSFFESIKNNYLMMNYDQLDWALRIVESVRAISVEKDGLSYLNIWMDLSYPELLTEKNELSAEFVNEIKDLHHKMSMHLVSYRNIQLIHNRASILTNYLYVIKESYLALTSRNSNYASWINSPITSQLHQLKENYKEYGNQRKSNFHSNLKIIDNIISLIKKKYEINPMERADSDFIKIFEDFLKAMELAKEIEAQELLAKTRHTRWEVKSNQ